MIYSEQSIKDQIDINFELWIKFIWNRKSYQKWINSKTPWAITSSRWRWTFIIARLMKSTGGEAPTTSTDPRALSLPLTTSRPSIKKSRTKMRSCKIGWTKLGRKRPGTFSLKTRSLWYWCTRRKSYKKQKDKIRDWSMLLRGQRPAFLSKSKTNGTRTIVDFVKISQSSKRTSTLTGLNDFYLNLWKRVRIFH